MTMGQLARQLDVPITYLSDVERDTRPAMSAERIGRAAAILGANVEEGLKAAAARGGSFKLPAGVSPIGQDAGASLMRTWAALSDEDFSQLRAWLDERTKGGSGLR
ncbi:MAG: helix-turn-helix transcriptional regulator [Deltaproteobacteria bacterium]|nr:helix-turn-helix transcriptional regulator [Deltaproteobacteria bacterium]